MNFTFQMSL